MRVIDFDLVSQLSCAIQDARHPDAAYFRVSSIAPSDLSAYLAERGVHTWGAFWRGDHTVIRCQHGQAGYAVALLDGAGLNHTTSYEPAPVGRTTQRRRPQRRRGGILATLKGLW
jgi:hypothetical protein